MKKLLLPLIVLVALLATADTHLEAAEFKKAADECSHAHAILGWSDFRQGKEESDEDFADRVKRPWVKMGWIVGRLNWHCPTAQICKSREKGKEKLKMVDSYEPGIVGQAEFKEYRVKGHDNGKAYVAHCGHGGTCNMLAARLHNNYKGIGKPRVYCGENAIPKMLHSPIKPNIPIPTDEELLEESMDDDDFDFDDDDDDDLEDDF